MAATGQVVFLFTAQYPYGNAENFIEAELEVLALNFKDIYIFPLDGTGVKRPTPDNVHVMDWEKNSRYSSLRQLFRSPLLFFQILIGSFSELSVPNNFFKNLIYLKSLLLNNIYRAECFLKFCYQNNIKADHYYSYWMSDWATVLALLRSQGLIPSFICRAHGFDLYAQRNIRGFIPFRQLQLRYVKRVFCISEHGKRYLQKRFPTYDYKFDLSRLGVKDNGSNPWKPQQELVIVSCSSLIPLKRIDMIIHGLSAVQIKVRWHHFGEGALKQDLLILSKKISSQAEVVFHGQCSNEEIMQFYRSTSVDFFINVSKTEGLPVSMQEAISFGIPVVATNVGGVPEIVNDRTGILLSVDVKPVQIAEIISTFKTSSFYNQEARMKIRHFWEDHFKASNNFGEFANKLSQL